MGATILLSVATFFWFMHPNVMVSSTNEAYNLTIDSASASHKTLELMTVVALVMVPVCWSTRAGATGLPQAAHGGREARILRLLR